MQNKEWINSNSIIIDGISVGAINNKNIYNIPEETIVTIIKTLLKRTKESTEILNLAKKEIEEYLKYKCLNCPFTCNICEEQGLKKVLEKIGELK